jgi:hypothetical protein
MSCEYSDARVGTRLRWQRLAPYRDGGASDGADTARTVRPTRRGGRGGSVVVLRGGLVCHGARDGSGRRICGTVMEFPWTPSMGYQGCHATSRDI